MIVVTGRMVQSVQRFLEPLGFDEPLICYQGAVVVDEDGTWLRHEPIPLELAREAIAAVAGRGLRPERLRRRRALRRRATRQRRAATPSFQHLNVHAVGDVLEWLAEPPTKLVCVGDPAELDGLEVRMKERFGDADAHLEVAAALPRVRRGRCDEGRRASTSCPSGSGFTRERDDRFGDGENDVELIEWAGYGIAVENAHARVKAVADWVCPPASRRRGRAGARGAT